MTLFIQIHMLTPYPAALINRDDVGFAKRMPFGGATRTRISSQCLKRHWRTYEGTGSLMELGLPETIRSRHTFEREIRIPLVEEHNIDSERARQATEIVMKAVLGESAKAKAKKAKDAEEDEVSDALQTGQITVLGRPEIDHLKQLALRVAQCEAKTGKALEKAAKEVLTKDEKKNLKELKQAAGLSAALFGRMVTSDNLALGDAAIHVAHALTVHEEESESDYFSAVDDLTGTDGDGDLGAGHIGNVELTSGLYYSYVVVDVALLVSNLEGCKRGDWSTADRTSAAEVVKKLIHIMSTVSPGAKLGSTAPYSRAQFVLVEAGDVQPRTLANAFYAAVPKSKNMLEGTYAALERYWKDESEMYGTPTRLSLAAMGSIAGLEDALGVGKQSVSTVADWAGEQIRAEA